MEQIAVIADDLTGANDTGVQFCQQGLKTLVIIDAVTIYQKTYNHDVLSINADTRHLSASEAYQRIYTLVHDLKKASINRIYKKIDSTLRGHPGAEMEAVMDACGAELALVVPSFPVNRRVVQNGYLLVETDVAAMPEKLCYIPDVLQQEMQRKVGRINLEIIQRGYQELATTLVASAKENQVLVLDAVDEGDLINIARAIKLLPSDTVIAGAAGLATHLTLAWELPTTSKAPSKKDGVVLFIAGSRNPVTAVQVQQLARAYKCEPVQVNTSTILAGDAEAEIERVLKQTTSQLYNKKILIIAVSSLFQQTGSNGDKTAGKAIARALGTIVGRIVASTKVKGLVVTGGDTAVHVCRALGATGIHLVAELVPGIPMGYLEGGLQHKDLLIITKAGGFGSPEAFIKVFKYLEQQGEQGDSNEE